MRGLGTRFTHWSALGTCLVGATLIAAQEAAPSTAQTSNPRWQAVLRNLASVDFADRQAAQKELDQATYKELETLRTLGKASSDPEVQSRILARVAAIEEELITNPPPISIHLKNAGSVATSDALSRALDMPVAVSHPWNPEIQQGQPPESSYTLDADERPFWDVYAELTRQDPFWLASKFRGAPSLLYINVARDFDRQGAFVAFLSGLTVTKTLNPQATGGVDPLSVMLKLECTMAVDPRVKVINAAPPRVTSIVDDAGQVLWQPTDARAKPLVYSNEKYWSDTFNVPMTSKVPKKLASIKGEGRFEVTMSETSLKIDAPEKALNKLVQIGNDSFTITRFDVDETSMHVVISMHNNVLAGVWPHVLFTMLDSAGKPVFSAFANPDGTSFSDGIHFAGPFTLLVATPDRTKEIIVPFELKDIALP